MSTLDRVEMIPLSKITIKWRNAQRAVNENHAQSIIDNFDPELFGAVTLAKTNGSDHFHVIDGQHRVFAAKRVLGNSAAVPAIVQIITEESHAAENFLRVNGQRRAVHAVDRFCVAVTAERKVETDIAEVLSSHGLKVGYGDHDLRCPASFLKIWNLDSELSSQQIVNETCRVLLLAYESGSNAFTSTTVQAVGAFVARWPRSNTKGLIKAIRRIYPDSRKMEKAVREQKEIMNFKNFLESGEFILRSAYNRASRCAKLSDLD